MDVYDNPSTQQDTDDRPIFYYLKNQQGKKVVTVCLIKYKEWFSRGFALLLTNLKKEKVDGGQMKEPTLEQKY